MMKIKHIFIAIATICVLAACSDNNDEIFDQPVNERLNTLLDSCSAVLLSANNGWNMQYFINDGSAGYNLLLNFSDESSVTFAGDNYLTNNKYLESTSSYEINQSNGPILEFDTYNDVLHPFADPDGYKLAGDFEFGIMNVSPDTIVLKGKKNEVIIRMNKISENISFEEYFNDLDSIENLLFGPGSPDLTLNVDGTVTDYTFSDGASSVFYRRKP